MYGFIVLAAYGVLMVLVTVLLSRKPQTSERFHVADRKLGLVQSAMSIAATWIWAPALFTSAEKAYSNGIPGLFWFLVPNILCLLIFVPFGQKIRRQMPGGITLSGYMAERYRSRAVHGAYLFALSALSVLSTGVQLLAGAKILSVVTGWPFWLLTVILAGNGLYETLLQMGASEADCYVVSGLTEAQKKKLMLADNRVFDLGVDDLSALDAFVQELKDDLDIPGYEEDLLRAMVMEAEEAAAALGEYGTIDEDRAEAIRDARVRTEAREEAAAKASEEYIPPEANAPSQEGEPARRFILCPKCGERIWL